MVIDGLALRKLLLGDTAFTVSTPVLSPYALDWAELSVNYRLLRREFGPLVAKVRIPLCSEQATLRSRTPVEGSDVRSSPQVLDS